MAPCTVALWMSGLWLWRCSLQPIARISSMSAPFTGYLCWSTTTSPGLSLPTRGRAQRGGRSTCWSWTTTHTWVVLSMGFTYRQKGQNSSFVFGCTFGYRGNKKKSVVSRVLEVINAWTSIFSEIKHMRNRCCVHSAPKQTFFVRIWPFPIMLRATVNLHSTSYRNSMTQSKEFTLRSLSQSWTSSSDSSLWLLLVSLFPAICKKWHVFWKTAANTIQMEKMLG